jgi:hypothetical protein
MTIAAEWDTFLRRKTFVAGNLAFSYQGKEPVTCEPVNEVTATLLFIDLVSILDEAAQQKLDERGLKPTKPILFERLNALQAAGLLLKPVDLQATRDRRNELAHEVERVRLPELEAAVELVESELLAWGYIGARPDYRPFFEASPWRPGADFPYEREFSIGVRLAKTGHAVLRYDFSERRNAPDPNSAGLRVERHVV